METISENRCFGGVQGVYRHPARTTGCDMTFGLFLPPQAEDGPVPVLWYLSGLTCTHENAMVKAGAQGWAAEEGLALVFPDTSPRGPGVAITGHSMGGHGALTLALANPGLYRSVSAFAPIANPSASDWGRKQLSAYLGPDEAEWARHDACALLRGDGWDGDILVDQGSEDQFIDLLKPEALAAALAETRTPHMFRMQPGYDHSYLFVASIMEDHIRWHAERLAG